MKAYCGSLNTLKPSHLSSRVDSSVMHPDTPTAINANLELHKLDEKLFPILLTGISCWPFLTLAFSCTKKQEETIFKITRKLQKELKKNGGRNIIGPLTPQSLRPYKSMCERLETHKKETSNKLLYKFLINKKFIGNPKFFKSNEKAWKKLFKKANGKQAEAYIRAYKDSKSGTTDKTVFDVVTQLLSKSLKHYDKTLWYGAFCYAFLRCLFGYFDKRENESFSYGEYSLKWKTLLLNIMSNKDSGIPLSVRKCNAYKELLNRIVDEKSEPPLAKVTKIWRNDERPVLSGLRLGIFHTLYFRPTPLSIEKYLET